MRSEQQVDDFTSKIQGLPKEKDNETKLAILEDMLCMPHMTSYLEAHENDKKLFQSEYKAALNGFADELSAVGRHLYGMFTDSDIEKITKADAIYKKSLTQMMEEKYFDTVRSYVNRSIFAEDIFAENDINKRTILMERWVNVAQLCLERGDYNTCQLIYSAMNPGSLIANSIGKTKSGLSKEAQEVYKTLDTAFLGSPTTRQRQELMIEKSEKNININPAVMSYKEKLTHLMDSQMPLELKLAEQEKTLNNLKRWRDVQKSEDKLALGTTSEMQAKILMEVIIRAKAEYENRIQEVNKLQTAQEKVVTAQKNLRESDGALGKTNTNAEIELARLTSQKAKEDYNAANSAYIEVEKASSLKSDDLKVERAERLPMYKKNINQLNNDLAGLSTITQQPVDMQNYTEKKLAAVAKNLQAQEKEKSIKPSSILTTKIIPTEIESEIIRAQSYEKSKQLKGETSMRMDALITTIIQANKVIDKYIEENRATGNQSLTNIKALNDEISKFVNEAKSSLNKMVIPSEEFVNFQSAIIEKRNDWENQLQKLESQFNSIERDSNKSQGITKNLEFCRTDFNLIKNTLDPAASEQTKKKNPTDTLLSQKPNESTDAVQKQELEVRLKNAEKMIKDYETAKGKFDDLSLIINEKSGVPTLKEMIQLEGYINKMNSLKVQIGAYIMVNNEALKNIKTADINEQVCVRSIDNTLHMLTAQQQKVADTIPAAKIDNLRKFDESHEAANNAFKNMINNTLLINSYNAEKIAYDELKAGLAKENRAPTIDEMMLMQGHIDRMNNISSILNDRIKTGIKMPINPETFNSNHEAIIKDFNQTIELQNPVFLTKSRSGSRAPRKGSGAPLRESGGAPRKGSGAPLRESGGALRRESSGQLNPTNDNTPKNTMDMTKFLVQGPDKVEGAKQSLKESLKKPASSLPSGLILPKLPELPPSESPQAAKPKGSDEVNKKKDEANKSSTEFSTHGNK